MYRYVFAQVGHVDNVPFPDATFDLVVLIGVSEWLVSLAQPARELFRVLKPGGRLIISADADKGVPLLRSAGLVYLVLARKAQP